MANFLAKIIGSGIGSFAEKIAGIVDKFHLSKEEKAQLAIEMEKLQMQAAAELEETMRAELGAKERILVAELNQGDTYTKRARPTVVYFGLIVMAFNYSIAPLIGWAIQQFAIEGAIALPTLSLPSDFWYGWSGIVMTWSVGRSMERRGASNNLVKMITGNNARDTISDKINVKSILE
jgi:hypothetical protein